MTNNELQHYGVLGMKWGVRHDKDYKYVSRLTKKYGKKAEKLTKEGYFEDAQRQRRRAEASEELDRRDLQYAKRVKTGANIALRGIVGAALGGRSYQRTLSALNGSNSTGFTGKKMVSFLLTTAGGVAGVSATASLMSAPIAALTMANPIVGLGAGTVARVVGGQVGRWAVSRIASHIAVDNISSKK